MVAHQGGRLIDGLGHLAQTTQRAPAKIPPVGGHEHEPGGGDDTRHAQPPREGRVLRRLRGRDLPVLLHAVVLQLHEKRVVRGPRDIDQVFERLRGLAEQKVLGRLRRRLLERKIAAFQRTAGVVLPIHDGQHFGVIFFEGGQRGLDLVRILQPKRVRETRVGLRRALEEQIQGVLARLEVGEGRPGRGARPGKLRVQPARHPDRQQGGDEDVERELRGQA